MLRPIGALWRTGGAYATAQMPGPAFSALVFIYVVIRKSFSDPIHLCRRGLLGYIAKAELWRQEAIAWIDIPGGIDVDHADSGTGRTPIVIRLAPVKAPQDLVMSGQVETAWLGFDHARFEYVGVISIKPL